MQRLSPRDSGISKPLLQRLDRVFGEINVVLVALAIGLAVLDLTGFAAMKYVDLIRNLAPVTQTGAAADQINRPSPIATGSVNGL